LSFLRGDASLRKEASYYGSYLSIGKAPRGTKYVCSYGQSLL
jgi:hypothetical protein